MPFFHTNSRGPDQPALRRAVEFARTTGLESPTRNFTIVVPTLQNLRQGILNDILGPDVVQAIIDRQASLDGCNVLLQTAKLAPGPSSTFLAAHISLELLTEVITANPDANIIFAPWMATELTAFLALQPTSTSI